MYLCMATTDYVQTDGTVLTVSVFPPARTMTAGDVEHALTGGMHDGATRVLGGIAINSLAQCTIEGGISPTTVDIGNVSINHTRLPIGNTSRSFSYAYCLAAPPGKYLSEVELNFDRSFREEKRFNFLDEKRSLSCFVCILEVLEAAGSIGVGATLSERISRENTVVPGPYATFLSQDKFNGPVTPQTIRAAIDRANLR